MIPLAIELEGFLSFRDSERLEFGRDTVWLLGGRNGVGKSSVFDAILFALYGAHRAGNDDLNELIHKQRDSASVRFDFELDGRRYRAERSVKRKINLKTGREGYKTEVLQMYSWQPDDKEELTGRWQAVPGTDKESDFKEWVRQHIGLSLEAFTVSVLLMQGKADGLVAQDTTAAKHRFNVLARLMELDQYQEVHKLAEKRRKAQEKDVSILDGSLKGYAALQAGELEDVEQQLSDTDKILTAAEEEARQLEQREKQAAKWKGLQADRIRLAGELEQARSLLGDAARIEQEGARWTELSTVLPHCQLLLEYRGKEREIVGRIEGLPLRQQEWQDRADDLAAQLAEARAKLEANQRAHDDDERQRQQWESRLHDLDALANLQHFHAARERLRTALTAARTAKEQEEAAEAQARQHESAAAPLRQQFKAATAALEAAERQVVRAETNWQSVRNRAERFRSVASEQKCGYCGQALDAEHLKTEQQRIEEELAACQRIYNDAVGIRDEAGQKKESLKNQSEGIECLLTEAQTQAESARHEHRQAEKDALRCRGDCTTDYDKLSPSFRGRIAEAAPGCWSETVYPSREELDHLSTEKDEAKKCLNDLRGRMEKRRKQTRSLSEQSGLLEEDQRKAQKKSEEAKEELRKEQTQLDLYQQRQADVLTALPPVWRERAPQIREADLKAWQHEHGELTACDAGNRLQRLREAQTGLKPMEQRLKELDEETERVPEQCRCNPEEIHHARQLVQARVGDFQTQRGRLEKERDALRHRRQKHEELNEQRRQADRQRFLYARLTELLGPKQLQRYLVRQAEQGVVENANDILKKLSDSRLQLRLRRDESNEEDAALQLVAYKPLDGQTYNLSFLSGSERFRVAVALALGIGQYANKRPRRIESIIIDEGFGCLDRDNRGEMIDELKRLIQSLRCILLVSHQEEFAEAFPDGHRLEMIDGTTRVRLCGDEEESLAEDDAASVTALA